MGESGASAETGSALSECRNFLHSFVTCLFRETRFYYGGAAWVKHIGKENITPISVIVSVNTSLAIQRMIQTILTVYFVTALFMYWEIIAEENLFIFQTDIRIVVIAFIRIWERIMAQ